MAGRLWESRHLPFRSRQPPPTADHEERAAPAPAPLDPRAQHLLTLQRTAGNRAVARVVQEAKPAARPTVTINKITVKNPGLFMATDDIGSSSPHLLVDNSMSDTLTLGGKDYFLVAQMCSVMAVFWHQSSGNTRLSKLDESLQREAALIVYANQTPDAQFDFARKTLEFREVSQDAVLAQVGEATGDTDLLIYSPTHVSAAKIGPRGIRYFDPELGEVATIDPLEMVMYVSGATRFLADGAAAG